jgi:hypothetical protein
LIQRGCINEWRFREKNQSCATTDCKVHEKA